MTVDRPLRPVPWLLAALVLAVPAPAGADHAPVSETVVVRANAFQPGKVEIAPAGTVTWQVLEDGHTIVADDGRFAFSGAGGGTLAAGSTPSFTVGEDEEIVRYHCEIHGGPGGQGMSGVLVVGHPRSEPYPTPTVRVPEDVATIAEAVAVVPDWGRVEIAPGTYMLEEAVLAAGTGVTITGTGDVPTDVSIVAGSRTPSAAFVLSGSRVSVANLSIRRMGRYGVHVAGADGAAVVDVVIDGEGATREGVLIEAATGAAVLDSTIRDVRRAGVRIEACPACGVLVARTDVTASFVGVLASGARGVRVADSTITGNAVGIVARGNQARATTIEVRGNSIVGNVARGFLPGINDPDRRLAVGAGVWLNGTAGSTVTGNTITGHGYGIVLAGAAATATTVTGNQLTDHTDADLAWDGVGAGVCFAANGATVTSEPPDVDALYPCDRPTVGVPYPLVDLRLLLRALEEATP